MGCFTSKEAAPDPASGPPAPALEYMRIRGWEIAINELLSNFRKEEWSRFLRKVDNIWVCDRSGVLECAGRFDTLHITAFYAEDSLRGQQSYTYAYAENSLWPEPSYHHYPKNNMVHYNRPFHGHGPFHY